MNNKLYQLSIITILFALMVAVTSCSSAQAASETVPEQPPVEQESLQDEKPEPAKELTPEAEVSENMEADDTQDTSAKEETEDAVKTITLDEAKDDLDAMEYVFLSVAYGLDDADILNREYQAGRDYYWRFLLYLTGYAMYNDQTGIGTLEINGESIVLPKDKAYECIAAVNSKFDGEVIPIMENDPIKQDGDNYLVGMGDMGATWPTLYGMSDNGDGTFTIYGGLIGEPSDDIDGLEAYDFCKITVIPNTYSDNPVYKYSVESATIIEKSEFDSIKGSLVEFSDDFMKEQQKSIANI